MIRHATDVQESVLQGVSSPPLPADHVLNSGAVLFPGAFDQHGCHLIVFPVDGQAKLSSALSKAEVVHFINYFLCLYNKMQEKESLVSVVADLTHASLPTTRFIAETLLLLELHKRTIHTVYITKPLKKDVFKLLLKILAPSKSHAASFKRVFLKGIPELSNYIDKSQLTTSLGGYFIYSHQSWVAFIKEIDAFVLEFLSVVQQLPSFISALQALSRLPLPATFIELHHFSSTNKAKFQQLRRELGLDELLRHCESMVQKLRHPEMEPCYQAMAGTALFTHTAFDMLQNHSRITAAVEKVEMLLQQAFSKANLQLQVFQLQEDALLITEQIETLQEKLQPYKVEIAKDAAEGVNLVSQFEASIHTPAMALVRCAEDLIHTLAEILPFDDQSGEHWVLDLERLKEKLQSTVHIIVQTLRAVSNYHHCYNKANHWYSLVLCENFLQELLSGVTDRALPQQQRRNWESIPAWRHRLSTFLKKNPPPSMEELLYLAHLSIAIPDKEIQQKGKKMSQQCMILRKLLISSGPVAVSHVQLALQWQFELLRSSHVNLPSGDSATNITTKDVKDGPSEFGLTRCETAKESGFDGTMISQLKAGVGREGVEVLGKPDRTRDSGRPATPQIPKEYVSGFEDDRLAFDFGSVENSSRANFQIIPKETMDFLNFEIQVNRSAALPSNPWLSLPIDNLEHSYTVTITQNPTPQQRDVDLYGLSDPHTNANRSDRSQDQPTQTELLSSIQSRDGILHSQSNLEDPEQSSIGDMLSSAITDVTEKSTYTTEGNPTLLWDSYDLHDQNRNPLDGVIDISLKDWDMKEQEGLTDVKKILDRTNEILEEEENILAQEAVLEALLRSEDEHNPWPLCDSEDHLCVMSSSKLSKAGVIGLKEDYFDPAKSNDLSDLRSTGSSSETKAPEDDAYCTGDATEADAVTFHSRLDLLTELREVHVLDKLFIEENLKICELRHCENPNNKLLGKKPSDTNGLSVSKEMEVFALQLEKEKGEVQKLEKSLDKEVVAKKHKDRAKKVVTCSIMEKARTDKEDRPLCDELLSGRCKTPQRTYQDQNEDTCKVENIQAELGSDVTEEASPPDDVPQCQDLTCFKADPTLHSEHMLNSTYDLKEPKPEISLTPEMRLHDGSLLPPVPKPRKASLPVNCSLREPKTHSPEQLNPALFSTAEDPGFVQLALQDEPLDALIENVTPVSRSFVLNSNVKECRNNNSNHPEKCRLSSDQLSGITTKHGEDTPVIPSGLLQIDLHPTLEIQSCSPTFATPHQQSAPQLPCDQPLEFDPSGRDEVNEDLPDGVESFEAMKISSRSGSPGNQAQLNINIREMMDFNTPIVLDTGSGLMKAGFADQDLPSIIFPTVIGLPKYEEIMNGNLDKETYIGHEAQHMRGVLTLKHPIKNGIINNWDEMEKIWHHTFQQLCVDPEDHPVLLTEAAMNPLENRQHMVEIMFECFNVPFIYMAMQAMLALYSTGRSTGVVFDSGDGTSHSVPVFEGYCLPHAVQRFPLAGADVTMQLIKLLQEQGVNMHTTAEVEIAREMKEMCCCVALDYEAELAQRVSSYREMHYTMPDGQIVTLSTERFRAPEILFKPELIGQDHYGMHESIFKSILSSDIDLRRSFLGNIVLSGGNTLLPGLAERLQAEIKSLVPPDLMESICVASPIDRVFSVWRGGALMANLPTFSSAWISREEYEEHGPQIVFRKCF